MRQITILIGFLAIFSTELNSQPNFVFLLADDCSYWDIGCYGSKDSQTPNIDQLAREGMLFTRSYQAAPMCSPTRHNIYTGQYPVKTGAYPNHTFVNPGTKSIVQYLKPLGYRLALSGKRHIGPEEIFDFEYLKSSDNNPDFSAVDEFIADASRKGEAFCLFLCSNEPHGPWNKGDVTKFNAGTITLPPFLVDTRETRDAFCSYLAEINYLDGQVGEALDLLQKHHLVENTVFIFTSEQGNSFPFAKWTCYNAGLHNAFIVRWPGKIAASSTSDALIDYSDVTPTFIDIAGGEIPPEVDGKSILPVLLGKEKKHKDYSFGIHTTRGINFGSEYYGVRSVTDGRYRFIMNLSPEATFKNGVTERGMDWWLSWKKAAETDENAANLIYKYQHRPEFELYDCIKDPYNQKNLAGIRNYKKTEVKLKEALLEWMKECGDKGRETEMEAFEHMKKYQEQ